MPTLDLAFPMLGLNKNGPLSQQPPLTSRDVVNVWPTDFTTGRLRGSIRPGSSAYFSGYMASQGNKIQALHSLPFQARHVSYAADSVPNELWAIGLTGSPTVSCIVAGLYDDFYAVIGNTRLVHYSRYGIELGAIELLGASSDMSVNAMHVDADTGAIYCATTTWVATFANVATSSYIWKHQLAADNKALELVWSIKPPNPNTVAGLFMVGDSLWTLEGANASSTTCSVELVEYSNANTTAGPSSGDRDPKGGSITGTAINTAETLTKVYPTGGGNVYPHDFFVVERNGEVSFYCAVGTVRTEGAGAWAQFKLKSSNMYALDGNYLFVNDESSAVDALHGGGIGYAIRADVTGNVYSIGRRNAHASETTSVWMRKLTDTSTAWSSSGGWIRGAATDLGAAATPPGYGFSRITLDFASNLIAPTSVSSATVYAAVVVKNDGTLFTGIAHYEDVSVPDTNTRTNNECRAVAVPSTHPDYQPDDYEVTDTVFVAGSNVVTITSDTVGASIHGYDILAETALQVSSRSTCRLGVCAGGIYRFTTSGTTVPTNSTGRSPVLSATSRLIQAADFNGEVFFTDGQDYAVYRPLPGDASNPNGEIVEWRATSLGIIPPRARLICRWRNRIVLAHTADSPWSWHMSAFNDPYDWDLFPPEPLETQAVSGQALPATGDSPDLIHALVPWSDDLLFMGCSRSILRFDGDPMAGGRVSVVSDKIGMAFGSPWCKDPEGRIYFFGSVGGVYVMSPTGELQWLTRDTIEDDISDIDMSIYRVELTWNSRDNGLHVWIVPYDTGGVQVRHYFWSQRTGGWFPVEFGTTAVTEMQPTTVHVIDGDTAAERVMIFGTEDGRVLKWDPNASGDDGQPIDARVLIGPIAGSTGNFEARFKRPSVVLAQELGGCHVKFFGSNTPETPEMPRDEIRVGAGRNMRLPIQTRGAYCWMQLRSATRTTAGIPALGERWAIESINVEAIPAGRAHAYH